MLQKPLLAFALAGSLLTGCNPFAPKYGKAHLRFSDEIRALNKDVAQSPVIYTDKSHPGAISMRYSQPDQHIVTRLDFFNKNPNYNIGLDELTGFTVTKTNPKTLTKEIMTFDGQKSSITVKANTGDTLYQTKPILGGMDRREHKSALLRTYADNKRIKQRRFGTPFNRLIGSAYP